MNVNRAGRLLAIAISQQVGTMLDRIQESWLATRHVGVDQRYFLSISEDGRKVLPQIRGDLGEANRPLTSGPAVSIQRGRKPDEDIVGEFREFDEVISREHTVERITAVCLMSFQGPFQPPEVITFAVACTGWMPNQTIAIVKDAETRVDSVSYTWWKIFVSLMPSHIGHPPTGVEICK